MRIEKRCVDDIPYTRGCLILDRASFECDTLVLHRLPLERDVEFGEARAFKGWIPMARKWHECAAFQAQRRS